MNKKIYKFCYKHPNFGIPNLMRYIVIANVAIWLISWVKPEIVNYLTFNPYYILHGQVWRLVSFMFIPVNTSFLALISFYFYYLIGNSLEGRWGAGPFTIYFFTSIILTVIYGFLLYFIFRINYSLDAQYIYLSMFFSFAALYPDMQVLLFFILPIKIKWLAWLDAALFVVSFLTTSFPANLLPVVAVLNFLIFCGGDMFASVKRRLAMKNASRPKNPVSFARESEKIRSRQQSNLYTHRCCVCGRTDADYPDLEFRYCSQCAGYHCFCTDHINSHIHFKE